VTVALDHLLTRPATLLQRDATGEDALGDPTYGTTETATVVELQQLASGEDHEGGLLTSRFRCWLPADAPLEGWDAISIDGVLYELDGDPNPVWNPSTRSVHHVEAELTLAR
jgi:hypothetical protein